MDIRSTGRLACLIAAFGVLQFLLLTSIAAFFYPEGFDYFGYFFSDLGASTARNGDPNPISSSLFFVTLVIVGVTLVPFWLTARSLFADSKVERVLSALGSTLGILSSPFTIGVALFPIDTQLETHILVTLTMFSLFVFATLLYSVALILNRNYSNYLGLVGLLLFVVSLVILVDPLATYVAFLQTIVTYGYFVWVLIPTYLVWRKRI